MKSLITFLVLLICTNAHASRIGMAPIERLLEEADIVAVITIVSGELISNDGTDCGASYKAKIDSLIKGDADLMGEHIDFGMARYKVGEQYLAFLNKIKRGNYYKRSSMANVDRRRKETAKKCNSLYPQYRVAHNSIGIFELGLENNPDFKEDLIGMSFIDRQEKGVYRDTFLVFPRFVYVQDNIKKYEVTRGTCFSLREGCIWVDMEDLFSSLGYTYEKFLSK